MMTASEPCRLREQAPVNQRHGEIGDGFPLDQHLVINQVVAGY